MDGTPAAVQTAQPEVGISGAAPPAPVALASEAPAVASAPSRTEQVAVEEDREQDRYLPIANISRIMKKALPPNAKIAKDAKETLQECVSEFISFVTSEGSLSPQPWLC